MIDLLQHTHTVYVAQTISTKMSVRFVWSQNHIPLKMVKSSKGVRQFYSTISYVFKRFQKEYNSNFAGGSPRNRISDDKFFHFYSTTYLKLNICFYSVTFFNRS